MSDAITWVGLDAHKKSISVAVLVPGKKDLQEWQTENEPRAVRRLARQLVREGKGEVRCCYEAGPCGYALKRQLEAAAPELVCEVIAPSLIPVKPGDHIKTDRRDARKLAMMLRAGLLTEVHPPTEEEEAVRDLCRCREDIREDLLRSRHRLSKFLLRRAIGSPVRGTWTQAHYAWLRGLRFERAVDQVVFDDYLLAVERLDDRMMAIDEHIEATAQHEPHRVSVAALRCFRGINTVTALTIVAELHGIMRFESPRALMAYLGLVPSEHSSAESTRRGSITKAGNSHVRRVLIEAAWHYRHRPGVGPVLRRRREGQSGHVVAIADKAQHRLNKRFRRLTEKGKPRNKAIVAVARELVGFVWATLHHTATLG
jgi:transposase